jgi:Vacuolar sorting protein 9 (VPS9) domain
MEDQNDETNEVGSLGDAIDMMEETQLCFHPVHYHSFAQVSLLISGSMRVCAGCDKRLHSVLGFESDSSLHLVRCMACQVYAHRTCAMSSLHVWKGKCVVNAKRIAQTTAPKEDEKSNSEDSRRSKSLNVLRYVRIPFTKPSECETKSEQHEIEPPLSPPNEKTETVKEIKQEVSMIWTNDGPPSHWANKVELIGHRDDAESQEDSPQQSLQDSPPPTLDAKDDDENCEEDEPVEISESSFASVARAIQENVLVHFRSRRKTEIDRVDVNPDSDVDTLSETFPLINDDKHERKQSCPEETLAERKERLRLDPTQGSITIPKETREALLEELDHVPPQPQQSSLVKLATGTYEAVNTASKLHKSLGMASFVGGIAGGMAGLVMAGPAGAVFGVKCGQTAGVLSVVIEGSVTVGVLVAGAAAGSFTAKQIQQHAEQRIISIGEEGSKRKVLLVRPHVWIDPAWEQICETAKRQAPAVKKSPILSLLTGSPAKQAQMAKKKRYQRDSDIVQTAEFELHTEEKVFLLVSRILNDKFSLPGHVYRALVKEHSRRAQKRKLEYISTAIEEMEAKVQNCNMDKQAEKEYLATATSIRFRRLDTHAVIKHVTATLLEVRPGFASSPTITEMSATAVEGLVFGELYDSVFEEILEETRQVDEALTQKLSIFANGKADELVVLDDISKKALKTLSQIPEAHAPVEKLSFCVTFLEHVSDHCSAPNKKALGADSLLKMVCLHLVVANVPHMNAEVAFLEEFARDERLLQGKEGYALVTLQASLHFLNASNDFENDIFFVDDD